MLTITAINHHNLHRFLPLFPEDFSLSSLQADSAWLAFGAEQERTAVGVGVARLQQNGIAHITHLIVHSAADSEAISARLIQKLFEIIAKRGGVQVQYQFFAGEMELGRYARFFQQLGFQHPEPANHAVLISMSELQEADWIKKSRLPSTFLCFSWGTLTQEEREQLEQNEGDWYPHLLSPFHAEGQINLRYSLGLRHQGNLIGWLIVEPKSAETALIRSIFVKEPYAQQGWGIRLFAQLVQLTARDQVFPYVTGVVEASNRLVLRFIERYCKEAILDIKTHYLVSKELS